MAVQEIIGVTPGDAAGIGAETIVKAYENLDELPNLVVIGDADVIERAIEICDSQLTTRVISDIEEASFGEEALTVLDTGTVTSIDYGVVRGRYGNATFTDLVTAIDLVENGLIEGIVMGPINSEANEASDWEYVEPLDLLSDRLDTDLITAMLIQGNLRVSHLSMHVSLREAIEGVEQSRVEELIRLTERALRGFGIEDPTIAVAGLNPHAGKEPKAADGTEEAEIVPAIEAVRKEGLSVEGPESPDTLFGRANNGEFDGVVALYHDQGHIPIKLLGFSTDGIGANLFLGLPFTMASVSHGTAYDIAGEGVAASSGMEKAITLVARSVENRQESSAS